MTNEYNFDEWGEVDHHGEAEKYFSILDKWFASDKYDSIDKAALLGDSDSVEFLRTFDTYLTSAQFHLQNNSSKQRIDYEIKQLAHFVCADTE